MQPPELPAMPAPKQQPRTTSKNHPLLKLLVIIGLILLLQIPVLLTDGVLTDRLKYREQVVSEIGGSWGPAQEIVGFVLEVPYTYDRIEKRSRIIDGRQVEVDETVLTLGYAYFLPEKVVTLGDIAPEERRRGIFEAVVYGAKLDISGSLRADFSAAEISAKSIQWTKARILLGVTDARRFRTTPTIILNGAPMFFSANERENAEFFPLSVNVSSLVADQEMSFKASLEIQGSDRLIFIATGKDTVAGLKSSWGNPSFTGQYLPTTRAVNEDGFQAAWTATHFGRGFSQSWTSRASGLDSIFSKMKKASFGVILQKPVDAYRLAERAQKYAILFFALIFAVFFVFEATSPVRIHAIQYSLVGCGLCLFFLGFLSLGEFLATSVAYAIAAGACTLLITLYAWSFLKAGVRALILFGALVSTYAYLYLVLQSQDYALIAGTVALFVALALTMFFTRKISWAANSGAEADAIKDSK